tara:strand:+ start:2965 stop:3408 length:444 start_codon:yes stop_codon:yes gene_type:complete
MTHPTSVHIEGTEQEHGFEGACSGFVFGTRSDNIRNWMAKQSPEHTRLCDAIQKYADTAFAIYNLNVDDEFQGEGHGIQLLEDAIEEADADLTVLISDSGEIQREGFVLESFYQSQGFMTVHRDGEYPVMIYPENKAKQILEYLYSP